MKEIKAFVRPFKVDDIFYFLMEEGFPNLTVSMAEGTGCLNRNETENTTYFSITDNKVARIEIVCNDSEVEKIVSIISSKGRTGNPGDGIIYVSDVERVIRIKNEENVDH